MFTRSRKKNCSLILILALLISMLSPFYVYGKEPNQAGSLRTMGLPPKLLDTGTSGKSSSNGNFIIYTKTGVDWLEVDTIPANEFLKDYTARLKSIVPVDRTVDVKIVKQGGGAAYLDSVLLGENSPVSILSEESEAALRKLSNKDLDLLPIDEHGMEFTFSTAGSNNRLSLTGRIEAETISTTPFHFPAREQEKRADHSPRFYTYELNSEQASVAINGKFENLYARHPLFNELTKPASGHPDGYTYGWVANDAEYLYAVIDFTSDNTMDGDKDYAKININTSQGIKQFKVSVPQQQWGQAFFTYTDKVTYQHKVYGFKIPLSELGISSAEADTSLQLAVEAYGTAAQNSIQGTDAVYNSVDNTYLVVTNESVDGFNYQIKGQLYLEDGTISDAVAFGIGDSGAYKYSVKAVHNSFSNEFLVVWIEETSDGEIIRGQLINADGEPGTVWTVSDANDELLRYSLSAAYDSDQHRYLVVWSNDEEPDDDVYGRFVSSVGSNEELIKFTTGINAQTLDLAYNSHNKQFLVVWREVDNTFGQMVDGVGKNLNGHKIQINTGTVTKYRPSVAANSSNGKFLVAWDTDGILGTEIAGQLVNANGTLETLIDNPIQISNDSVDLDLADLIYDVSLNRYVAIWEDYTREDIYGTIINSDGSLANHSFIVTAGDEEEIFPSVAFNSSNSNLLIVHEESSQLKTKFIIDPAASIVGLSPDASDNIQLLLSDSYEMPKAAKYTDGTIRAMNNVPSLTIDPTDDTIISVEGTTLYAESSGSTDIMVTLQEQLIATVSDVTVNPLYHYPKVAYDADHNRYLSVYSKVSADWAPDVYGQFLLHDGTPSGPEFVISDAMGDKGIPVVAYDEENQAYLVVWVDSRKYSTSGFDIYGQYLNTFGSPISTNFVISEHKSGQFSPTIAYDSTNHQFLVAWSDDRIDSETNDIYGRVVRGYQDMGNEIAISSAAQDQSRPALAYDAVNRQFLAVWSDERLSASSEVIFAQSLHEDGTAKGGEIQVSSASNSQYVPKVSFDSENSQFLVTWLDAREDNAGIYGRLIQGNDRTLKSSEITVAVSNILSEAADHSTVYDLHNHRFVVTWSQASDQSIRSTFVDSNGVAANDIYLVSAGNKYVPNAAYNTSCGNTLVSYMNYNDDEAISKLGYNIVGNPCGTLTGIQFTQSQYSVTVGQMIQSVVQATYSGSPSIDITSDAHFSYDGQFISVDPNTGVITGLSGGTTVLTAIYGGKITTAQITITELPVTGYHIFGDVFLNGAAKEGSVVSISNSSGTVISAVYGMDGSTAVGRYGVTSKYINENEYATDRVHYYFDVPLDFGSYTITASNGNLKGTVSSATYSASAVQATIDYGISSGRYFLNSVGEITLSKSTPPTLTADTSANSIGADIDLTFTDHAAWRGAITDILVDGQSVTSAVYSIAAGKITLAGSVFQSVKTYSITIKANDFTDASINQVITLRIPPTLTADSTSNVVNASVDITFTDDTAWRGAITGIHVDGQSVTSAVYSLGVGNLTIAGSAFPTAKSYTITVKAANYTDATVNQTIAVSSSGIIAPVPSVPANNDVQDGEDGVTLGDGAAKVTQETTPDGQNVTKVDLDAKKLGEAFGLLVNKDQNAQVVTIEVKGNDPVVKVVLPGNSIIHAANTTPDAVVVIKSGEASYSLPVGLINIDAIAKELGRSAADAKVNVTMAKVSGTKAQSIQQKAQESGLQIVGTPIEFTITVEAGGKQTEVNNFGTTYVTRTLVLTQTLNGSEYTAVVYDPVTGDMSFVPAEFITVNGQTIVSIKRSSNSVYTIVQSKKSFQDITKHWAHADIELLASKLIIQGQSDTSFGPDNSITRAEFAALLVRSLGLKEDKSGTKFNDVTEDQWFAGAIGTAAKVGIVEGMEDGSFRPHANISREQMAVMIARAVKAAGHSIDIGSKQAQILNVFADRGSINSWALTAVAQAVQAGIIQGMSADTFVPSDNATRAQAAVMLKRFLQVLKFIN